MDKAKTKNFITCEDHEDQPLVRVNPDPSSQKHVYCLDCLMQSGDSKSLYENSKKIVDFIAEAGTNFAEHRNQVKPTLEVPKGCLDVIARQAESLEQLSKHIAEEKKKIEIFFEDITNVVIDALCQLKNEYLEVLDNQVTRLHDNYAFFEKIVRKLYPKKKDIDIMFPTNQVLEEGLTKASNALELEKFIKDIKLTLESHKDDILSKQSDEAKQAYFDQFSVYLKNLENKRPIFDQKKDTKTVKDSLMSQLNQILLVDKPFTLINEISESVFKPDILPSSQSAIIGPDDFLTLKEWLPNDVAFNPKLLYRMTRDGKNGQAFHSCCDKKGATITLIRCKYEGASNLSIIGGFSDVPFDEKGKDWQTSYQNFIFSLTPRIKCIIVKPESAFLNSKGNDIWFGPCGNIGISNNFTWFSSEIGSSCIAYADSFKIIPPECFKGFDKKVLFHPEEIEVYAVNNG